MHALEMRNVRSVSRRGWAVILAAVALGFTVTGLLGLRVVSRRELEYWGGGGVLLLAATVIALVGAFFLLRRLRDRETWQKRPVAAVFVTAILLLGTVGFGTASVMMGTAMWARWQSL